MNASHTTSYRQIFQSSVVLGSARVLNMAMGMLRTKILAVFLGPEGTGLLGIYDGIATMVGTVTDLGVSRSGVREIAQSRGAGNPEGAARTVLTMNRVVGALGLIGTLAMIVLAVPDQPPDLCEPGSRDSHRAAFGLGAADRAHRFAGRQDPGHGAHSRSGTAQSVGRCARLRRHRRAGACLGGGIGRPGTHSRVRVCAARRLDLRSPGGTAAGEALLGRIAPRRAPADPAGPLHHERQPAVGPGGLCRPRADRARSGHGCRGAVPLCLYPRGEVRHDPHRGHVDRFLPARCRRIRRCGAEPAGQPADGNRPIDGDARAAGDLALCPLDGAPVLLRGLRGGRAADAPVHLGLPVRAADRADRFAGRQDPGHGTHSRSGTAQSAGRRARVRRDRRAGAGLGGGIGRPGDHRRVRVCAGRRVDLRPPGGAAAGGALLGRIASQRPPADPAGPLHHERQPAFSPGGLCGPRADRARTGHGCRGVVPLCLYPGGEVRDGPHRGHVDRLLPARQRRPRRCGAEPAGQPADGNRPVDGDCPGCWRPCSSRPGCCACSTPRPSRRLRR